MSDATAGHSLTEPALLTMRWRDVLFAHWDVAPAVVDESLPEGLRVDTHDDRAWLGVVGFRMADIRPRGVPFGLSFGELNLRTYVRDEAGTPGIYFYNLDASDRLGVAVARSLFRLPYYRAEMDIERRGRRVEFRSRRVNETLPSADFDATYGPDGPRFQPEPGTREFFLTERYRFYTESDSGTLYYGDVGHEPWSLAPAAVDVRENDLFAANGFDHPGGAPRCHYSPGVDVRAGRVHRV